MKKESKLASSLPPIETTCYFTIWITGIAIALYSLHVTGNALSLSYNDVYLPQDLTTGWASINSLKDTSDVEWKVWTELYRHLLPWLLVNLAGAEVLRWCQLNGVAVQVWYCLITLSFIALHFNFLTVIFLVGQTLVCFLCLIFKNQAIVWIFSYVLRAYLQPEEWFDLSEDKCYLAMLSSSWLVLKCVCFSTDMLKEKSELSVRTFVKALSYSLYLPTMFTGPLLLYSDFDIKHFQAWTIERIFQFLFQLGRCLFWFLLTEVSLHYFYINAILMRYYFVEQLSVWQLAGLGIGMGHFFLLKYVVFYGLTCAWAKAETYETPKTPCCVSRVYLYSYMWRNFDQGLYKFLVKYIYIPVLTKYNKTVSSIVCFLFIYLWHGGRNYVLYWTVFNFLAISLEAIAAYVSSMSWYQFYIRDRLSNENYRRFLCVLAAPLHYFSMVANFYFISASADIGLLYIKQYFTGNVFSNLIILFFLYGATQCAVTLDLREQKKKIQ